MNASIDAPVSNAPSDRARLGVYLSFLCPELIEFFGHLGFDWLFLDAEHTPLDRYRARELIIAADGVGLDSIVRVAECTVPAVEGFLDAGARGIIAPDIRSAAEARDLVAAVKFCPEGRRGSAPRSRAAQYGLGPDPKDYCHRANQWTLTVALIESQAGIDRLDEIMDVEALDYLAIGSNDLGYSLGFAEGGAHPQVQSLVASVQARIRARQFGQLAVIADARGIAPAIEAGASWIAVPDSALLASAGRTFLEQNKLP